VEVHVIYNLYNKTEQQELQSMEIQAGAVIDEGRIVGQQYIKNHRHLGPRIGK